MLLKLCSLSSVGNTQLRTILGRQQQHQCVLRLAQRSASQLYPAQSRRWDDAMAQAEIMVGDSSNFSNLQKWLSGEFNNITKYLTRLIGTNHPMLETAKRCSYISEGKMGSSQARGLTVILMAKAAEELGPKRSEKSIQELIKNQVSLAEMTEMTYSAYMIHRGVMDLGFEQLASQSVESIARLGSGNDNNYAKGLHYGNKVSVLCGDFLLAYVMRGLGDLFSSRVVNLIATSITDFMEGEFLLIDDWRSKNYLISDRARDFSRWHLRTTSSIGSLQGNTCEAALILANVDNKFAKEAGEFGRNLGLAWQAHTELQPFLNEQYAPIELPEMIAFPSFDLNSVPVMFCLQNLVKEGKDLRAVLDKQGIFGSQHTLTSQSMSHLNLITQHRHQEMIDYQRLHKLVQEQRKPIKQTIQLIKSYSEKAIRNLESFPPSEAKSTLQTVCESLHRK